jgi:hypothetical protein
MAMGMLCTGVTLATVTDSATITNLVGLAVDLDLSRVTASA